MVSSTILTNLSIRVVRISFTGEENFYYKDKNEYIMSVQFVNFCNIQILKFYCNSVFDF